jgi:malate dehydrogenase
MLKEHAPSIPPENITAMTRLDHNRALAQVGAGGLSRGRQEGWGAGYGQHRRLDPSHSSVNFNPARNQPQPKPIQSHPIRQVAERAGVLVTQVKNVIIWGNHSSTQYPDVSHGTVDGKPIRTVLAGSEEWLDGEFVTVVQQRGAAIIKVGGPGWWCSGGIEKWGWGGGCSSEAERRSESIGT